MNIQKLKSCMKSIYKIIWSERAVNNLKSVISYLEETRTEKEINNFSIKLENYIDLIQANPEFFPISKKKSRVRRVVITRQNTLYYTIDKETIKLICIFDTRQNPKKTKI